MADNIILSNDALGTEFFELRVAFQGANVPIIETSAHGLSASGDIGLLPAPFTGRIVNYGYAVVAAAVSASGFVSGTVDAGVFINGNAIQSASGAINMANSASGVTASRTFIDTATTSTALVNPPQLNPGSTSFNKGDMISFKFNARSVGSAAAGTAGAGFSGFVTLRRTAA